MPTLLRVDEREKKGRTNARPFMRSVLKARALDSKAI